LTVLYFMITFDLIKLDTNILHHFVGFFMMKVMTVSMEKW